MALRIRTDFGGNYGIYDGNKLIEGGFFRKANAERALVEIQRELEVDTERQMYVEPEDDQREAAETQEVEDDRNDNRRYHDED